MMAKMCHEALIKEEQAANELDAQLVPLHQALFVETNPSSKMGAGAVGFNSNRIFVYPNVAVAGKSGTSITSN